MQDTNWKLNCLFEPMEGLAAFGELTRALEKPGVCSAYGPDDSQRAHLLAAAALKLDRPLLVIEPNDVAAARMAEDLNVLLSGAARLLPPRDITFLKTAASSRDLSMRRIEALGDCLSGSVKALVTSADAVLFRLAPAGEFAGRIIDIAEGAQIEPAELMQKLTLAGYERVQLVEARGQCALRGGIMDVYPVGGPGALRVEFFDDEVAISRRPAVRLYPAQEIPLDADARARAAESLQAMLETFDDGAGRDRQASIEKEFDLIPFEEFLRMSAEAEDGDGEAPRKKGRRGVVALPKKVTLGSALKRNFGGVVEVLKNGLAPDGGDSLLPVLLDYRDTPVDYLDDPVVVFDQPERLRERCENRFLEFRERYLAALDRQEALPCQAEILITYDELLARLSGRSILLTNLFMRAEPDFAPTALVKFECRNAAAYQGNVKDLARDLDRWKAEGWRVALLAGGTARGERLEGALNTQNSPAPFVTELPQALEPGQPMIFPTTINRGFIYPEIKFAVVAESDIYGVNRQRARARAASGEKIAAFTDLKVGDYVVHENHGIGQYMGMVRLASDGTYRDFLHIRYQGSDKLYVPTDQLDRVQKYIGSEGEAPKLNRLSGGEWQRQKSKVRQSIREIAGDLLKLYAQRESIPGFAFDPDTPWQREFEQAGHGAAQDHGPAALRRRGLRQDRGGAAGHIQVCYERQAGCHAGPHHHTGAATLRHDAESLRGLPHPGGDHQPLQDGGGAKADHRKAEKRRAGRGGGHPSAAGKGRGLQGPGPAGGGRGTALWRHPQGGHQADEALGGRADADGHAHPTHAAHEHGGHTGHVPAAIAAGGAIPGANLCG